MALREQTGLGSMQPIVKRASRITPQGTIAAPAPSRRAGAQHPATVPDTTAQ